MATAAWPLSFENSEHSKHHKLKQLREIPENLFADFTEGQSISDLLFYTEHTAAWLNSFCKFFNYVLLKSINNGQQLLTFENEEENSEKRVFTINVYHNGTVMVQGSESALNAFLKDFDILRELAETERIKSSQTRLTKSVSSAEEMAYRTVLKKTEQDIISPTQETLDSRELKSLSQENRVLKMELLEVREALRRELADVREEMRRELSGFRVELQHRDNTIRCLSEQLYSLTATSTPQQNFQVDSYAEVAARGNFSRGSTPNTNRWKNVTVRPRCKPSKCMSTPAPSASNTANRAGKTHNKRGLSHPPTPTSPDFLSINRYSVLQNLKDTSDTVEPVPELLVIGDSIVRNIKLDYKLKTAVKCFPGARVKDIECQLESALSESNVSTVVLHCGTNDTTLRQSEILKNHFRDISSKLKQMKKNIILSGPLPSFNRGCEKFSRLFNLNNWLSTWCKEQELVFVNNWNCFLGKPQLFAKDGLHPSKSGAILLSRNIQEACL